MYCLNVFKLKFKMEFLSYYVRKKQMNAKFLTVYLVQQKLFFFYTVKTRFSFCEMVKLISSLTSDLEPQMAERFPNKRISTPEDCHEPWSGLDVFSFIWRSIAVQDLVWGKRRLLQFQRKLDLILELSFSFI